MRMTYESMMLFAETWIAAWNRRDIDAVLVHFADDAQFVSPAAHKFVGHSVLRNRKEIEDYWRTALARISTLEFKLDHAIRDERRRELNVVYEANLNGERKRACEIMQFEQKDDRSEARHSMGPPSEAEAPRRFRTIPRTCWPFCGRLSVR
jgi:hypothetical protein